MLAYRYRITLFDPLYYAREGLAGAFTPHVLHATAVNHAVTAALGLHPENQPFVIADENGGMDVPRYTDSRASPFFYFTPAAVSGNPVDWTEIAKGDNDGFLFQVLAGESLKATQLNFLPPKTQFHGFVVARDESLGFPERIRLGSFRGMAALEFELASESKALGHPATVGHPVDPLVSKTVRGVMENLFPYPVVRNAVCHNVYELTFDGSKLGPRRARMAWPDGYSEPPRVERLRAGHTGVI